MALLRFALIGFVIVFLLPAALSLLVWKLGEHPASWREANWSSAAVLPAAADDDEAAVYIMAARTGGLKGALSEHSWIVVKPQGAARYERFDKVGWGSPIRRNGYPADGRWYSNVPRVVARLTGEAAERAIPRIRAAIDAYPFAANGGYRIFPGPNSNSFVAHVLRSVPELGAVLPPAAVGRDYPVDGRLVSLDAEARELRASLFGYAGFAIGARSGLELQFLGLVAGIDPLRGLLKVPGFGSLSITG
ncbi:DUF3750 domain-containing protein [Aureimonas phyllosphaerae]|uniref:DUF3750 domain-containing protein n=1 Tax=Aureimonas phyllosphaerae TaxID=1166078 RepID=A0A7W6BZG7_9HYPH|nr:DUF3750 domain-containing protein [Aureimonas phyllosphaerae]MBB3935637.1 hypothetical protein [Aureimonas phyllosphaerae]MBB3959645.1 hypothetical protein [Aureimonas phyllosphaerae]SFF13264.1 Protein of unknown function [Aureimonas phyllosphaerae]